MFSQISPLFQVLAALLDYLFKAAVNYRNTDEGRAEWLDIEAAFEQATGDDLGASEARAEAVQRRENPSPTDTPRGSFARYNRPTGEQ